MIYTVQIIYETSSRDISALENIHHELGSDLPHVSKIAMVSSRCGVLRFDADLFSRARAVAHRFTLFGFLRYFSTPESSQPVSVSTDDRLFADNLSIFSEMN